DPGRADRPPDLAEPARHRRGLAERRRARRRPRRRRGATALRAGAPQRQSLHPAPAALPDAGAPPLVVGVGNAVRGDDAAGLIAARRLGGIALEGDPTALVDLFARVSAAVVIDAVRTGA